MGHVTIMSNVISKQILDEMLDLSVAVIKYAEKAGVPRSIVDQVTRSVTSIGANYSEAQDAASKRDFISKIYIAKKEASETQYWLKLIQKLQGNSAVAGDLEDKTQRFIMLLQKIINSARSKSLQANG